MKEAFYIVVVLLILFLFVRGFEICWDKECHLLNVSIAEKSK